MKYKYKYEIEVQMQMNVKIICFSILIICIIWVLSLNDRHLCLYESQAFRSQENQRGASSCESLLDSKLTKQQFAHIAQIAHFAIVTHQVILNNDSMLCVSFRPPGIKPGSSEEKKEKKIKTKEKENKNKERKEATRHQAITTFNSSDYFNFSYFFRNNFYRKITFFTR